MNSFPWRDEIKGYICMYMWRMYESQAGQGRQGNRCCGIACNSHNPLATNSTQFLASDYQGNDHRLYTMYWFLEKKKCAPFPASPSHYIRLSAASIKGEVLIGEGEIKSRWGWFSFVSRAPEEPILRQIAPPFRPFVI